MKQTVSGTRYAVSGESLRTPQTAHRSLAGWVLVALFFLSPLTLDLQITRYKLWLTQSLMLLSFAFWCVEMSLRGSLSIRRTGLGIPATLYALAGCAFYFLSDEKPVASMELARVILGALTFFTLGNCLSEDPRWLRRVVLAWIVGGGLACGYGLLQKSGGLGSLAVPQTDRIFSTFGNPIFFGAFIVATLPLILGAHALGSLSDRRFHWGIAIFSMAFPLLLRMTPIAEGLPLERSLLFGAVLAAISIGLSALWSKDSLRLLVSLALCAIFALALWHTKSRAAWIACAASCALGLLLFLKNFRRGAIAFLLLLAGLGIFVFKTQEIWRRQQEHLLIWRDSLRMWKAHPFLGVGMGTFHIRFPEFKSEELKRVWPESQFIVNDAHSEFVQLLSETGLVGFFIFLSIIAAFFWRGLMLLGKPPPAGRLIVIGLLASGAAILVQNLFSVDMRFTISTFYFFSLVGMLASLGEAPRWEISLSGPLRPVPAACGIALSLFLGNRWVLMPVNAYLEDKRRIDFFDEKIQHPATTISELEELLKSHPEDARIHFKLGYVYAKEAKKNSKAIDLAIFHLGRAAESSQADRAGAYNNLANIYFLLKNDRKRAIEYWQKSLGVSPNQKEAHSNLGIAFYYEGKLSESAGEFKKVLEMDPKNNDAILYLKRMRE